MAQLGSGQGSSYASAIDTHQLWRNGLAPAPDSDTRLDSEAFNDFAKAIVAIQHALGAKPQGTFGSVAARLNQFLPGSGPSPATVYFANTTEVHIPGASHGLGTGAILYQLYDDGLPAMALAPGAFTVEVDPATYDITIAFAQAQSGYVVLSASTPMYATAFIGLTSLVVSGTTHQLQTAALLYSLYDDSHPQTAIRANTFTVDPVTFDVMVTFAQPQSGTLLLSAAGPRAVAPFTNQTTVSIAGTTHQLGTQALLYQVYDAAAPANPVRPDRVSVHPTTYTVTLEFLQPQSGSVVLVASQSRTGQDFEIRDGGSVNTDAVVVRSNNGNLEFQIGDGKHATFFDQYGQGFIQILSNLATASPFYGLGLGVQPAYSLHLALDSAAKPGTNTWTIASDARLKTAIEPFLDGLAQVLQLEPISYAYNGHAGMPATGKREIGLLAQAVQAITPYLVGSYRGQLTPETPETDILTYEGHALSFVLLNAIKELHTLVQAVSERCSALEAAVALLQPPAP